MASARKPVTKKLVNSPESCVDDNLRGVVTLYPGLRLHPDHRVVTTQSEIDTCRVAVIGGGGSGHEPFAAGFVGAGMLTGAVAGGVFASPPTTHVLYAITQLYKYHSGGVIVIIGNYTGDRLNFGKAIEKAKIAGIKVEGVIVCEDVASSHNKTGGRGMCGEVFLYKLCGAMSAQGRSLEAVRALAIEASKYMATLGVCLSACSLPGQPPLFEILPDEMELGAGVHGEAGIKKMKFGTATEVVGLILDQIVNHLKLEAGDKVSVMLNNLGGTSIMEMNILSSETKAYLSKNNIIVVRIYAGHMKSSLEMHGFQICLLHLNKNSGNYWLDLLDAATEAPGWPATMLSLNTDAKNIADDEEVVNSISTVRKTGLGPKLSLVNKEVLRRCLEDAAKVLVDNEELLNRLDSGCGDGDCGITMKNFGQAIQSYTKTNALEYPSSVLWEMSEIAEKYMGGTSGGIYSLGLSAASQAFAKEKAADSATWASAWESAIGAITKYGGAEPGDRTMLDTLSPALIAFKNSLGGCDWKTTLEKTLSAAEDGAKATANMIAKAGRASYVSREYARDEDAGARAVALWVTAIITYLMKIY